MAYNVHLADRIRQVLNERHPHFNEKVMMGGLCYVIDDKMCVGIVGDKLMARIGPDRYEEALLKPVCKEMDFTGKPMKGYVFVEPEGIDLQKDLEYWVQLCLDFNPLANSSKKKKQNLKK